MHQIKLNDRLSESLQQGFDKKIFGLDYGDFAAMAGPELFDQIFNRVKTWQTPLYFGEAEIMLLKPLAQICEDNRSNLTQDLFAKAGAYGILEEIARLSSTRDMAAGLSKDTIINHPVIQQLVMMGIFDNPASKLNNVSSGDDRSPRVNVDANPKDVMSLITNALAGAPIKSDSERPMDVISLLNGLYSIGTLESQQETIGNYLANLQETMKMGKRYPMSEPERQQYFTRLIHPIINWLAKRSDEIFSGAVALDSDDYSKWADFLIVARWFSFYLDCVEDYDTVFPTQLIPSQSQMQVAEIARAANRYKGIFLKLTQSSMTTAMTWSFSMWDEMYNFFLPFLPPTSAVKDLGSLMQQLKEDYDQVKDPWSDSMVARTIERMRTLSGADVFMERSITTVAEIPSLIHGIIEKVAPSLEEIPTGASTLTSVGKFSQMYKLAASERESILIVLSNIASSFNSSVSVMMQATQFITRDFKLPILESTLPDSQFEYTFTAKPLDLLPQKANFTRIDDTVRSYAPWVIKDDHIQWINVDKINTLVRAKDMQDSMVAASPSTVYWPKLAPIQAGEPYVALFAKQPVLSPYTQNVTTDMLPLSWASWFKLWATHNPESRPESILTLAATAMAQDPARNEAVIATCFAATCAIVHWKDGSKDKEVITPNIPWIYGTTFNDWVTVNKPDQIAEFDHAPSLIWSSPIDSNIAPFNEQVTWYSDAKSLDGELHHYCFVLWQIAPALTDLTTPESSSIRWTLYQLVKGSYFTIPVRRSSFPDNKYVTFKETGRDNAQDDYSYIGDYHQLRMSDRELPPQWMIVKGFCPVSLTLPHLTWDLASSCKDELSENADLIRSMYSYVNIPVKFRFNQFDKSYSFIAYYNNPAILVEYDDFEDAASSDKVLPSQEGIAKPEHPDLTTDNGAVAAQGVDNSSDVAPSLNQPADISNKDNAAQYNPVFKVETQGDGLSDRATAHKSTEVHTEGQMKGVPKADISPATHAQVEFSPAAQRYNAQESDAVRLLQDDALAGAPSLSDHTEQSSDLVPERTPKGKKLKKKKGDSADSDSTQMDTNDSTNDSTV